MKKLLILLLIIPTFAFAQQEKNDTLWTKSGNTTINFSQVSLHNWAAGGKSSMSGVMLLNYAYNYKKNKLSWDNSFDFRYGFLKEESEDLRKSDDKIDINSKLGIVAKGNWNYAAVVNFKSQFASGYNYPDTDHAISKFMAPGYLNFGIGMDYKTDIFSVLMAPISGKLTFVTDDNLSDEGAFGVEPGKNMRAELGATVKAVLKKDIVKNVTLDTKVDLFSNYIDQPKNIDVDWTLKVIMKVNDYLSANLITHLIYDNDVKIQGSDSNASPAPALQFMESFGVGLTFKL